MDECQTTPKERSNHGDYRSRLVEDNEVTLKKINFDPEHHREDEKDVSCQHG